MEERTLLADIEVEKQKKVEKAFNEYRIQNRIKVSQRKKNINPFSASAFPQNEIISENNQKNEEIIEKNVQNNEKIVENDIKDVASESSTVIERPNYDMIETLSDEKRTEIFGEEKEEQKLAAKPKRNIFKLVMLSIMFGLFGVWGIVNLAQIDSVSKEITQVTTEYGINYAKYIKNLEALDGANSNNMNNLFQTIDESGEGATSIKEQSNWFDRFCNFIGGLFGG